jgi:O-antigen ligase
MRGWSFYLVASAFLVALLVPTGPGQLAIIDVVNFIAFAIFGMWTLLRGRAVIAPFALPMLLIFVGSLIATVNAESVSISVLAMTQDLYLYVWFVVLVNVIAITPEPKRLRLAWLWAAVAASIASVLMLALKDSSALSQITGLKGGRAVGTFYNPNMLADYLVMSLFIVMSLSGQVRGLLLWAAAAVILFGLVATKSNGGLVALAVGLGAWAITRSLTKNRSLFRLAGLATMFLALGMVAWWVGSGWGVGTKSLNSIGQGSFLGRSGHSAEVRLHIWQQLGDRYARFPLGIGPGNSNQQLLSIADQERPDSYLSKEAHNDYVGYLIERGPLALLGLAMLIGMAFTWVVGVWKRIRDAEWKEGPGGAIAAGLIGALAATSVHSFMIEKMHFRHFWLFLAVLWGFSMVPNGWEQRSEARAAS